MSRKGASAASREADLAEALRALHELGESARKSGVARMSLAEINKLIAETRLGLVKR